MTHTDSYTHFNEKTTYLKTITYKTHNNTNKIENKHNDTIG